MPTINSQTKEMQNGDVVLSYTNTVGPQSETFTFATTQETVILKNRGSRDITYTLGGQSGTLSPSQQVKVTGSITDIVLSSQAGTQQFEVWADEAGTKGVSDQAVQTLDTKVTDLTTQLAQNATVVTLESFSGVTDAEKFNQAVASISTTGGTIKLKNKIYTMDSVVLPAGVNVIGSGNTVLQPSGAGKRFIFQVKSNSIVKDIIIKDNGFYLKSGVQVGDYDYQGIGAISNSVVENVVIELTTANSGGIKIGFGTNISVHKCVITNTLTGDYGIVLHSDNSDLVENVFISHNLVDGFYEGISSYGTGSRHYLVIDHNIVKNCPTIGINMYHAGMSTTMNNIVYKCRRGIYFATGSIGNNYGRGNVCNGNQIQECTEIGLYAEQLRNGKLADNTIQGCDIGIYAGATITYSLIDGNGLTFNRIGLMISNDFVPAPMQNYDNGDLKISNNFIAFNTQNGMELAGIRGLNVIENNDIRANNTSNGDYWAILFRNDVISSISRNRTSETVIIKGNNISNTQNSNVNMITGYQKGIKTTAGTGLLTIVDNIFNNATSELTLTSLTAKIMRNIFNSVLGTPYSFSSVTYSVFGNIGLFEGHLVATATEGININQGITSSASLPTADATQRGKIIKVNRVGGTNDDELYMCVYLSAGGFGWKKITMA